MMFILTLLSILINTMTCMATGASEETEVLGTSLQSTGMPDTGGITLLNSRPPELNDHIRNRFIGIQSRTRQWAQYAGMVDYGIMGYPDPLIVQQYITAHPHKDKEFVFVDFGSGDHSWGRHLALYLERAFRDDISTGAIVVHIISLTGDNVAVTQPIPADCPITILSTFNKQSKGCTVYELSSFPLENIDEELPGLRVDLVFSFATFRHMADPVGTLTRAYNMLKTDGAILTEGTLKASVNGQEMPNLRSILDWLHLDYLRCPFSLYIEGALIPLLHHPDCLRWPLSSDIEGILIPKRQNNKAELTYKSIQETPELMNTAANVTSPVIVNFAGDIPQKPRVAPEFAVEAFFPDIKQLWDSSCSAITTRRESRRDLDFSGDVRLFEEYVCPCHKLMLNYLTATMSDDDLREKVLGSLGLTWPLDEQQRYFNDFMNALKTKPRITEKNSE